MTTIEYGIEEPYSTRLDWTGQKRTMMPQKGSGRVQRLNPSTSPFLGSRLVWNVMDVHIRRG